MSTGLLVLPLGCAGLLLAALTRLVEELGGALRVGLHGQALRVEDAQGVARPGITGRAGLIEQAEGSRVVLLHPKPREVEGAEVGAARGRAKLAGFLEEL